MTVTEYRTVPPRPQAPPPAPPRLSRPAACAAVLALLLAIAVLTASVLGHLGRDGAVTLVVFLAAVWLWVFARVPDATVALGAALALVLTGTVDTGTFTGTLGDSVIWLLVGSFLIAAAVTATGLAARVAARVLGAARGPRTLVHLVTLALLLTTFAIPATSGRAALALPVFLVLAAVLRERPRLVRTLAVLMPSVILFSAVGSLLGAGAHLITSEITEAATGTGFGFTRWLLLGLPLALLWSHLAAEVVLAVFTDRAERTEPLRIPLGAFTGTAGVTGPLTRAQRRVLLLLAAVVAGWCTEPWHGIDPAVIAMLGALAATAPWIGATTLTAAAKTIPWPLLLFLAATLCLGIALTESGASEWLAGLVFGPVQAAGAAAGTVFVLLVLLISLAAHLVIQSRSARSAVLVPVVVATAPVMGIDPLAAAFLSTAAAGFCHTLPASAKPVALFAASAEVPGYRPADLLRYSAAMAPLSAVLLLGFAFLVWPALGLPLTR